jgi:hypothetical protein
MIHTTKIYLVTKCYEDSNKIYIGKTINSRESNHKKTYGKDIIYTYIDEVNSLSYNDWEPLETYWIEQFRQWGFEVLNKRKKGGSGPEFCLKETKQKISQANSGHPKPEGFGDKISQIKKGIPKPKGFGERISKQLTGKPNTKNRKPRRKGTGTKISEAKIGHECYLNPNFGKKISEAKKGIPNPKLSQAKTGVPNPKISEAKKGVKIGPVPKRWKPVEQYALNGVLIMSYPSKNEAELTTGIGLKDVLTGRSKTAGGYIWKYKE